jgi:hypothetical protein
MWFAKWFGGRSAVEDEDEPARFTPPALKVESAKAAQPVGHGPAPSTARGIVRSGKSKKGFDPYNSGAFERRNAWERIGRR